MDTGMLYLIYGDFDCSMTLISAPLYVKFKIYVLFKLFEY